MQDRFQSFSTAYKNKFLILANQRRERIWKPIKASTRRGQRVITDLSTGGDIPHQRNRKESSNWNLNPTLMTHKLWVKGWVSFSWFWSIRATSLDVLEVCLFYRCGCARTDASNVRFCNSNSRFNALTDEFYWKSRECDGVKDCANGIDESNCRGGTRAPPTTTRRTTTTRYGPYLGEIQCKNGISLEKSEKFSKRSDGF